MGKSTFFCIFSLTLLGLFIFFNIPFLLRLSFAVNFLILWIFTYYNIFIERRFSPFLGCFIVFNLLFFIIAPMVQIHDIVSNGYDGGGKYIQKFPFKENFAIRANIYILIFNLVFFISYMFFKNKVLKTNINLNVSYRNVPLVLLIIALITLLIILVNIPTIIFQYQNEFYKEAEQTSVANYLLVQKFLFFIPFAGVILSFYYLKTSSAISKNYVSVLLLFFFYIAILLIIKNPFTEKRNALGPIYITLIFLFFKDSLNTNFKVVRFMFLSMVLLFPSLTIFTHSRNTLTEMIAKPSILADNLKLLQVTDAFNSLHYDAYPNFLATIDYRDNKPVTNGAQLGSTIFFFVPRSVWHGKPEVTGFKIGNYLIERYSFNWNNLSNPYISEGYINFGLFGILLFAIILAIIFSHLIRWLEQGDILKSTFAFYFSIYLMYFLRGDLANGFAFIIATFLAIIVFPKILFLIINHYVKQ